MEEISGKLKDLTFLLDRYGVTLATAIFLGWVSVHQLKDIKHQLDRCVMNERMLMTRLGIKFTLESDK